MADGMPELLLEMHPHEHERRFASPEHFMASDEFVPVALRAFGDEIKRVTATREARLKEIKPAE